MKPITPRAVQFADISLGTAKKTLRGLRAANPRAKILRPEGPLILSGYVPKGQSRSGLKAVSNNLGGSKVGSNSVIVPRGDDKFRIEGPARPRMSQSPVLSALHESGHAADGVMKRYAKAKTGALPRLLTAAQSGDIAAASSLGKKFGRSTLRIERRANQRVLAQVARHGSPEEVATWKRVANDQMKKGYRKPMYDAEVANTDGSLNARKGILRQLPFLRSKFTNLSRITPRAVHFRTRPETEKRDERTLAGKIAAPLGAAAVVGGTYALWHGQAKRKEAQKARSAAVAEDARQKKIQIRSERAVDKGKASSWPRPAAPVAPRKTLADLRKQVLADPKRRNRLATTSYVRGLQKQPAQAAGNYSDGGFNYGVPDKTFRTKPSRPTQSGSVKIDRRQKLKNSKVLNQVVAPVKKAAQTVEVKSLSAITPRAVYFNSRSVSNGQFHESASPLTVYRKASRVVPWVKRAGEAAGDVGDIASGKPPKDPFYKKSWFKNAALATAIGAPILAARGHRRGLKIARGDVHPADVTWIDRKVNKHLATSKTAKKISDAVPFARITPRAVHFSLDALDRGWDLRDARGKSARVYAPGSRRRERREKEWGEKTDNIRLVRNAAIATAAGLGGLAIYQGRKLGKLKRASTQPTARTVEVKPGVQVPNNITHHKFA